MSLDFYFSLCYFHVLLCLSCARFLLDVALPMQTCGLTLNIGSAIPLTILLNINRMGVMFVLFDRMPKSKLNINLINNHTA